MKRRASRAKGLLLSRFVVIPSQQASEYMGAYGSVACQNYTSGVLLEVTVRAFNQRKRKQ